MGAASDEVDGTGERGCLHSIDAAVASPINDHHDSAEEILRDATDEHAKPLRGPTLIRTLRDATRAYRSVVEDSHSVIEEMIAEAQIGNTGMYFTLVDHLRALLEPPEIGSLPAVETECAALLGEACLGRHSTPS